VEYRTLSSQAERQLLSLKPRPLPHLERLVLATGRHEGYQPALSQLEAAFQRLAEQQRAGKLLPLEALQVQAGLRELAVKLREQKSCGLIKERSATPSKEKNPAT